MTARPRGSAQRGVKKSRRGIVDGSDSCVDQIVLDVMEPQDDSSFKLLVGIYRRRVRCQGRRRQQSG